MKQSLTLCPYKLNWDELAGSEIIDYQIRFITNRGPTD